MRTSLTRAAGYACVVLLSTLVALVGLPSSAFAAAPDTSKEACAYSADSISTLNAFGTMVGHQMSCAQVYVDQTDTWQQWETPWILSPSSPDLNWVAWATAPGTSRQLVITQNLIPTGVESSDWLDAGAAGDDEGYARTFAANLVAAGLGNSIIRLAPEANGNWKDDSLGSTPQQWALWDQFWSNTVIAMRSVPGANFQFDWCVNYLYRDLPLSEIYPGNDVVNIIGIDVYDDGNLGSTGAERWNAADNRADGVQAVVQFAAANDKPLSIPEWGVDTVADGGGGDDPAFVNGIASVVADNPTAYQSYFYKGTWAQQFAPGTQSVAAYAADFDALEAPTAPAPVPAPVVTAPAPSPTAAPVATTAASKPVAAKPTGSARRRARNARTQSRNRRTQSRDRRRLVRNRRTRRFHHDRSRVRFTHRRDKRSRHHRAAKRNGRRHHRARHRRHHRRQH
jgi:hypothetical protein